MSAARQPRKQPRASRRPPSEAAARQAQRHSRIRKDHSDEIKEDYVELIAQLVAETGAARTVDLAARLGVSHVTVTKTVARLKSAGLVKTEPYRAIFLTPEGQALADRAAERHALVVAFLRALGVNQRDAETDAEGIEHHLSKATLGAMQKFLTSAG